MGETHETLHEQRKTELFANENLTVHADSHTKIDGKWLVKSGAKAVHEAGVEHIIKAGGTTLKINAAGVFISGPLYIQTSVGGVISASPLLPEKSVSVTETPLNLFTAKCRTLHLNNASETGAPAVSNVNEGYMCLED